LQALCLCDALVSQSPEVRVLFLQHPLEQRHPKNTAWLTHLCLAGSRLEVGERFDPVTLQRWLCPAPGVQSVLLYPPDAAGGGPVWSGSENRQPHALSSLQLVVLDGTWKKTNRMIYQNPALQALPRYPLPEQGYSRYQIRQARQSHQRSTLEATVQALNALEQRPDGYADLLQVLEALQSQWQSHLPTSPAGRKPR
jgi:DTW domain-containing protein YfiP